eukprot:TRINITY_DN13468_c0_g1_i1.p1 TRINITY_DN13468_c0_g1~~TRINITY_DN13468_c0_g1_i1.p1  ORF type:complete len:104 (+),score=26.85 TRINITY_DN13468_c0_g1_i1:120-431(+)
MCIRDSYQNDCVQLYSGMFGKGALEGDFILAGGGAEADGVVNTSLNGAKLFEYGETNEIELTFSIEDIPKQVDCVDFSFDGEQFCMAGGDGYLRVFKCSLDGL